MFSNNSVPSRFYGTIDYFFANSEDTKGNVSMVHKNTPSSSVKLRSCAHLTKFAEGPGILVLGLLFWM